MSPTLALRGVRVGPEASRASSMLVLVGMLTLAACRPGVPIIDTAPKPAEANGTISGTVRGPEGTSAIEGRVVEAINVATGERSRETTSSTGGFTFKLKPGKYRVQVTLLEGESFLKQPGEIDLNKSDVDAHADFVVSGSKAPDPGYSYRPTSSSLGAPIA